MSKIVMQMTMLCLAFLPVGCADTTSKAVDSHQYKITDVCIKLSDQQVPSDFVYTLKEGLLRHGIAPQVHKDIPSNCEYSLSYRVSTHGERYHNHIATQGDGSESLNDVHLALYRGTTLIAYADRDSPKGFLGKEIIDLSQWDSNRSIVEPLVDGLLDEVEPDIGDMGRPVHPR